VSYTSKTLALRTLRVLLFSAPLVCALMFPPTDSATRILVFASSMLIFGMACFNFGTYVNAHNAALSARRKAL
jgi:hypothetical protein